MDKFMFVPSLTENLPSAVPPEPILVTPLNVAAPPELILNRLVELVAKSNVFAADKYIPFVGTDAPLGMKADAVAVELNDALNPAKAVAKVINPVDLVIVKGVSINAPASEYLRIKKLAPALDPDSVPLTSKFIRLELSERNEILFATDTFASKLAISAVAPPSKCSFVVGFAMPIPNSPVCSKETNSAVFASLKILNL
jgi:hypothetical protein